GSSGRAGRRRLAPSEKYEVFVEVLTQQATQREAAEKGGVDRSTVVGICRTAEQGALEALAAAVAGRPGRSAGRVGVEGARGGDRAVAGDGDRAGRGVAPAAGKSGLGLSGGLVPPRVDAQVKAALLGLVEYAMAEAGWSVRKAAEVLGLDHVRVLRWQARAAV